MIRTRSDWRRLALAAGLIAALDIAPVSAQIDPLLFLKGTQPNVIVAVDTATRMQRDAPTDPTDPQRTSNYYDTALYPFSVLDAGVNTSLGLSPANASSYYRRKYVGLRYAGSAASDKFVTDSITAVGDKDSAYGSFEAPTRLSVARAAIDQAIKLNQNVARFGLIKTRQYVPDVAIAGNAGPVANSDPGQAAGDLGGPGKWAIGRPTVLWRNADVWWSNLLVASDAANANASVLSTIARDTRNAAGLVPAGADDISTIDAPVTWMLIDAYYEAWRLITSDVNCRNTVVVLVVGGTEGTTLGGYNPAWLAPFFRNIAGRPVPIYVVAIAPPAADRAQLQDVASISGGQYVEVTKAMIDAALAEPSKPAVTSAQPTGTVVVPQAVSAINVAVQHAFATFNDFNTSLTGGEFVTSSPIVGTVNLEGASDITGTPLSNTTVYNKVSVQIPQRSNVLLNSGFSLPGFDGKLRAFRMYKPQVDASQVSGYKFVNDGTRLWVASVPAAASRNIYTVLPDGTMTAFTALNAATLATYMNVSVTRATEVINHVRSQPLGAIVSSTPAIMDAPSVDPPPDSDYPGFAADNDERRTLIWIGTNDGMLHAIDGRLGQEVWAFIPFNLLPKLTEVRFGQSVGSFTHFVDGSPKVADVRVSAPCEVAETSCWRTYLFIGQGPGGTFYQTFDVTLDDMGAAVSPTSDDISPVLSYFSDPSRVAFKWAFPSYSNFDYTLAPWGDVKLGAPAIEKTVGQSWADPAVGRIESEAGSYALVLGSGFLPYSTEQRPNRAGLKAGTTFYVLGVETGEVFDSVSVGADAFGETVDNCAIANDCTKIKNALQADPVATGPPNSRYITMTYLGDLDGRVWRFDLGMSTVTSKPYIKAKPGVKLWDGGASHPIFSSMATVNVGSTKQYLFFGTGSDLLPSNGVSLQYKLVGVLDNGSSGTQTFSSLLAKVDGIGSDEKVTAFPAVAGDIVFFTTTTTSPATPCTLPSAKLYAVTFIGGPAYDTTGDGNVTGADSIVAATIAGARATAPFIADRHLVFGTGDQTQIFGDPEGYDNGVGQAGVRILSWRELR